MADRHHTVFIELSGGLDQPGRRRLTIDACSIPSVTGTPPAPSRAGFDVVFTVCWELDAISAAAIARQGVHRVDDIIVAVVDLSGVSLIDSAGARCLESFAAAVAAAGGRFLLRDPSSVVRKVFDVLHLTFETAEHVDGDLPACHPVWVVSAGSVTGSSGCERLPIGLEAAMSSLRSRDVRWTRTPLVDAGDDALGAELWRALHGATPSARHRSDWWNDYERVNARFGDTAVEACGDRDTVWIHDYPLLMTPAAVRMRRPDVKIGFSLHTSFDAATMSRLDHAHQIGRSFAACDLIGVQTLADADQLDAFLVGAGVADAPPIVVSPTSIDPARVLAAANRASSSPLLHELTQRTRERVLIVAVDELDHTSAIGQRIAAYDLAFRHGTIDPDRVHIVQIVNSDSRHDTAEHQALRVEIERLSHKFNATWTGVDRQPILEMHVGTVGYDDTLAIMRRAHIAVVTPTRAGMGVMAKEFAVLAEATGGVLVLSDRVGASAELGGCSILVNGSSPDSIAAGLHEVSLLDAAQRTTMAGRRAEIVRHWTAEEWCSRFLQQLAERPARRRAQPVGRPSDLQQAPK